MQCSNLPALAWPLERATSWSALLQLCKTLLSFRYSLHESNLKYSKKDESMTRLCTASTAAAVSAALPPAPGSWSLASPGELSPQLLMKEGSLDTRVCPPHPWWHFLACLLRKCGVEVEGLPPESWATSSLRQRQMSPTSAAFQEQKFLSYLALTREIAQNLFSFQSLPRQKKKSLCKCICSVCSLFYISKINANFWSLNPDICANNGWLYFLSECFTTSTSINSKHSFCK